MNRSFVRVAAAVVSSAAALSGCAPLVAPGVGVATSGASGGALEATLAASLDDAYQASADALEELGLPVIGWAKDAFGARLIATQALGGDVDVALERRADGVTSIAIRVGASGDEAKARFILRTIVDDLGRD